MNHFVVLVLHFYWPIVTIRSVFDVDFHFLSYYVPSCFLPHFHSILILLFSNVFFFKVTAFITIFKAVLCFLNNALQIYLLKEMSQREGFQTLRISFILSHAGTNSHTSQLNDDFLMDWINLELAKVKACDIWHTVLHPRCCFYVWDEKERKKEKQRVFEKE